MVSLLQLWESHIALLSFSFHVCKGGCSSRKVLETIRETIRQFGDNVLSKRGLKINWVYTWHLKADFLLLPGK